MPKHLLLFILFLSMTFQVFAIDNEPENNTFEGATQIKYAGNFIKMPFEGNYQINDESDEDWFVFTAKSGEEYTITAKNLGRDLDITIDLYDNNQDRLKRVNKSFEGREEVLTYTAAPSKIPQDYYIRIAHSGIFGSDLNYDLTMEGEIFNKDNEPVCDKAHLEACDTEEKCDSIEGQFIDNNCYIINFNNNIFQFEEIEASKTSEPQTLIITHESNSQHRDLIVDFSIPPPFYQTTSNCDTDLSEDQSCEINIVFQPETAQVFDESFEIAETIISLRGTGIDNNHNNQAQICQDKGGTFIDGQCIIPEPPKDTEISLSVDKIVLNETTRYQTLTLTNKSENNIVNLNFSVQYPTLFTITKPTITEFGVTGCEGNLLVQQKCAITLSFNAKNIGTGHFSDTLNILSGEQQLATLPLNASQWTVGIVLNKNNEIDFRDTHFSSKINNKEYPYIVQQTDNITIESFIQNDTDLHCQANLLMVIGVEPQHIEKDLPQGYDGGTYTLYFVVGKDKTLYYIDLYTNTNEWIKTLLTYPLKENILLENIIVNEIWNNKLPIIDLTKEVALQALTTTDIPNSTPPYKLNTNSIIYNAPVRYYIFTGYILLEDKTKPNCQSSLVYSALPLIINMEK